jgi:hypothetical protein
MQLTLQAPIQHLAVYLHLFLVHLHEVLPDPSGHTASPLDSLGLSDLLFAGTFSATSADRE